MVIDIVVIVLAVAAVGLSVWSLFKSKRDCKHCAGCDRRCEQCAYKPRDKA